MMSRLGILRAWSNLLAFVVPKLILLFTTEDWSAQPYSINFAWRHWAQGKDWPNVMIVSNTYLHRMIRWGSAQQGEPNFGATLRPMGLSDRIQLNPSTDIAAAFIWFWRAKLRLLTRQVLIFFDNLAAWHHRHRRCRCRRRRHCRCRCCHRCRCCCCRRCCCRPLEI